jgi:transcriptional antiterminator RfaH
MAETDAVWHVLHVRPRCEKKMAAYCQQHTLEHYLPLREETKIYQRRKVTVAKPLFTGYVFTVFAPRDRTLVLKSNIIVRILPVSDQERLIRELAQVRQALTVDPTLGAVVSLTRGRRVRVTGGPFQGMEGLVEVLRGHTRVVLNVEMIGQGVAVEADAHLLEPLD